MKRDDINWCKNLFGSLKDGGLWAVPRSGLIYRRTGESLNLIQRLPDFDEAEQARDAEAIETHFRAAGINVQ